eukprot:1528496-Prymnesium_polylepis.1
MCIRDRRSPHRAFGGASSRRAPRRPAWVSQPRMGWHGPPRSPRRRPGRVPARVSARVLRLVLVGVAWVAAEAQPMARTTAARRVIAWHA